MFGRCLKIISLKNKMYSFCVNLRLGLDSFWSDILKDNIIIKLNKLKLENKLKEFIFLFYLTWSLKFF